MPDPFRIVSSLILLVLLSGCDPIRSSPKAVDLSERQLTEARQVKPNATPLEKVVADSIEQTTKTFSYDPAYVKLDYPNGDVPIDRGVCADVVIRAFRKGGVDLQKEVHEDLKQNFAKYPRKWGAKKPDRNIDHRRVPNLMTWFERQGKSVPPVQEDRAGDAARDYLPGDVIVWELGSGLVHIGLVSGVKVKDADRYAIVHNIGSGAKLEDVLFAWKIIGHYRYFGTP
ncbi:MAG TPA: DUF1287 domain-containing protein [Blastocatellia bacterium]|nr:DUF1287 domain-containing protein [Blastocatellia bacterium]